VKSLSYKDGAPIQFSDHGRKEMSVDTERLELRERMASGRMRSKFIDDKYKFSTSWEMLPSRVSVNGTNVIADGGASAIEMISFYRAVKGEFTMTIYADGGGGSSLLRGARYGTFKVFFDSFNFSVVKRGKNFDFFNIDMSVVEA
jgi:hypothetical protein